MDELLLIGAGAVVGGWATAVYYVFKYDIYLKK